MVVASLKCSGSDFVSCIFTVFFLQKISTIILKTSERLCCTKKTKSAHQITKFLGKRTVPSHTSVCVSVWRLCIQEFWFFVCFCRKYTEMLRQPPTQTYIHTKTLETENKPQMRELQLKCFVHLVKAMAKLPMSTNALPVFFQCSSTTIKYSPWFFVFFFVCWFFALKIIFIMLMFIHITLSNAFQPLSHRTRDIIFNTHFCFANFQLQTWCWCLLFWCCCFRLLSPPPIAASNITAFLHFTLFHQHYIH